MTSNLVLDAYPLLVLLQKEPGWTTVRELLAQASATGSPLSMSAVNVGEVYYRIWRTKGEPEALELRQSILPTLPIRAVVPDCEGIYAAAALKASCPGASYADCFCAALALEEGATVVTGDREFEVFEPDLEVLWLP